MSLQCISLTIAVAAVALLATLTSNQAIDPVPQVSVTWCACKNSRNCIRGTGINGLPDGKYACKVQPGELCYTGCYRSAANYSSCARPFGDHLLKVVKGCAKPPPLEQCAQPFCEYYCSSDWCNEGLEDFHACHDKQLSY